MPLKLLFLGAETTVSQCWNFSFPVRNLWFQALKLKVSPRETKVMHSWNK